MKKAAVFYFVNAFLMSFLIYLYQTSKLDQILIDDTVIMVPTIITLGVIGWVATLSGIGNERVERFATGLSSLLVELGFLGTLYGTAMALGVFIDMDTSDNAAILKIIGEFMSGVSVAINTSIWGVVFSMIILMNINFLKPR